MLNILIYKNLSKLNLYLYLILFLVMKGIFQYRKQMKSDMKCLGLNFEQPLKNLFSPKKNYHLLIRFQNNIQTLFIRFISKILSNISKIF